MHRVVDRWQKTLLCPATILSTPGMPGSIGPMTDPIMPGAEPWSHSGGSNGVLVLHGFTGNPHSMRTLAEAIADAGYSVELPLLAGHGTSVEDMMPTRFEDWSGDAEAHFQALAARCDRVAVVGLSMGGALTCWLAERHPHLAGIVLVNPLVHAPDQEFRDGIAALLDSGTEVFDAIGSDIAKEGVAEVSYPGTPLAAVLSLFAGVDEIESRLSEIHCPTLLFSSREDHVVDPLSGDIFERDVSGPVERIFLDRSYHVATLDHDAPEIEARTVAFLDGLMGGPGEGS